MLKTIYERLHKAFGPQKWWPAETPFEVIVGAILTQNTNWSNVERALHRLKKAKKLNPTALKSISQTQLATLIKPAGYFNVKARRLKNFISFLYKEYHGELRHMARTDTETLRRQLLGINGIGPETADSILLYAFNRPVFVVDAYTKRILYRHNIAGHDDQYHDIQGLFCGNLKRNVKVFNEYHALIVRLGKEYCRPKPQCERCPLKDYRYSLTEKCGHCHKALPESHKRHRLNNGYLCDACRAKY